MLKIIDKSSTEEFVKSVEDLTDKTFTITVTATPVDSEAV